jgi:HPt (histidine-containing phosphotransfer) domain-containing protein
MSDIDAMLAAARADYASRLPSKLAAIEELTARGAWAEARRAAHKLRGSAATYGFVTIGDAAAVLEQLATDASSPAAEGAARAALQDAIHRVRIEVERAAGTSR